MRSLPETIEATRQAIAATRVAIEETKTIVVRALGHACPRCGSRIGLTFDCPPIPLRCFDWAATCSDFCDESNYSGRGSTRELAVQDWNDWVECNREEVAT